MIYNQEGAHNFEHNPYMGIIIYENPSGDPPNFHFSTSRYAWAWEGICLQKGGQQLLLIQPNSAHHETLAFSLMEMMRNLEYRLVITGTSPA